MYQENETQNASNETGAVAQELRLWIGEEEEKEEEKSCPEGWERVVGDVYGVHLRALFIRLSSEVEINSQAKRCSDESISHLRWLETLRNKRGGLCLALPATAWLRLLRVEPFAEEMLSEQPHGFSVLVKRSFSQSREARRDPRMKWTDRISCHKAAEKRKVAERI